eukprot:344656-Pelagomonas_calceolata.AAC.1
MAALQTSSRTIAHEYVTSTHTHSLRTHVPRRPGGAACVVIRVQPTGPCTYPMIFGYTAPALTSQAGQGVLHAW